MKLLKIIIKLILAYLVICVFNYLSGFTHFTLSMNLFNILMIAFFDVFGFILCIFLKIIL